jgi:hypothetical protein
VTTGRARIGGWTTASLVPLLSGGQIGQATAASDGSAWLWSWVAGEADRIDPDSGQVERRRELGDTRSHRVRGHPERPAPAHPRPEDRVRVVARHRRSRFSGRLDVGARGDPHLALGGTMAAVIERTSGAVRVLDPATLRPTGLVL